MDNIEKTDNTDNADNIQDQLADPPSPKKKHSGIGIASFVISIVAVLGLIGCMVAVAAFAGNMIADPNALNPEEAMGGDFAAIAAASLGMFVFVILAFVGAILGIVGLFQKDRAKLFAILGTVFNGLIVGVFAALFVIGIIIGFTSPVDPGY